MQRRFEGSPCVRAQCAEHANGADGDSAKTSSSSETLRFTPDASLRRATAERFIAALRGTDPQAAAQIAQLQKGGGIFETMERALAPFGLRADDLGDAYTMWWIAAWSAFAGDTRDTTPAQAQAVAAQARRALIATPEIAKLTVTQKQQMADELLLQGLLLEGALQAIKADPSLKPKFSAAAAAMGRTMGVDLAAMTLTERGFEAAGGGAELTERKEAGHNQPAGSVPAPAAATSSAAGLIARVVFYLWGDMQFHPTVLLKDGTAYDVSGPSLEAVPPERSRLTHPKRWGRWQENGRQITLIDDRGSASKWTLGGGGLYQSFSARTGQTLNATYKSVSGSQVGEVSMLLSGRMTFKPDGRFFKANAFNASGSGRDTGVTMGGGSSSRGGGNYAINGHRIILKHQDGRTEDLFFGYGSQGSPPRPDEDMIFIGATGYVIDR
jgi:hypothetical protein